MSEKTTAFIEAMKKQTIGVEVEMNNITRRSRHHARSAHHVPPRGTHRSKNEKAVRLDCFRFCVVPAI